MLKEIIEFLKLENNTCNNYTQCEKSGILADFGIFFQPSWLPVLLKLFFKCKCNF